MISEITNPSGNPTNARGDKDGNALVTVAHAKYADAVRAGRVFTGGTDASGVAPGTALGTTAAFALENPLNSGVHLVVLTMSMGYKSGTLGAGTVLYTTDDNPSNAVPIASSTAITPTSSLLGSGKTASAKLHDAATLLNTPTILRPFVALQAALASTAVTPWQVTDHLDGEIVLGEGSILAMEGIAASGSSPLVFFGCTWEEVSI